MHANIAERREFVKAHIESGGQITAVFKRLAGKRFNCSISAIDSDWRALVSQARSGWSSLHTAIKNRVLDRDNRTCQYCGISGVRMIVEHVIPASQGGVTLEYNLVAACCRCNVTKKSATWIPKNIDLITQEHIEWKEKIFEYNNRSIK